MITGGNTKPGDWYEDLYHDPDFQEDFNKVKGDGIVKNADVSFTPDVSDDAYLNMGLTLPDKEGQSLAVLPKRIRDASGSPTGTAKTSSLTVGFMKWDSDGHKTFLAANVIAENVFIQVDDEGNSF